MPTGIKKRPRVSDPWMTVPEAARTLGVSPFKARSFALRGVLVTQVIAGHTVMSRESVERLARDLGKQSA